MNIDFWLVIFDSNGVKASPASPPVVSAMVGAVSADIVTAGTGVYSVRLKTSADAQQVLISLQWTLDGIVYARDHYISVIDTDAILTAMNEHPPGFSVIEMSPAVASQIAAQVSAPDTVVLPRPDGFQHDVYRQIGHIKPLNFSWSEATLGWNGSEFAVVRSINGGPPSSVQGAVSPTGIDALGRYRFQVAYDSNDYPVGEGAVDFIITAGGKTKSVRVFVTASATAEEILAADPSLYASGTLAGQVHRSVKANETYRHQQISRSSDNKTADVSITKLS